MFSIEPKVESTQKESTFTGSELIQKLSFDMTVIMPLPTCQGLFEFQPPRYLLEEKNTNHTRSPCCVSAHFWVSASHFQTFLLPE